MGPQSGNDSMRKMRTFADDVRRARGEVPVGAAQVGLASSVVAPTVSTRSNAPVFISPDMSKDRISDDAGLLDIRNVSNGTEEGTIVSEHKATSWSFTDAVTRAFSSWWKDTIEDLNGSAKPLPRVAPASKRAFGSTSP